MVQAGPQIGCRAPLPGAVKKREERSRRLILSHPSKPKEGHRPDFGKSHIYIYIIFELTSSVIVFEARGLEIWCATSLFLDPSWVSLWCATSGGFSEQTACCDLFCACSAAGNCPPSIDVGQ
jgi:hypothetical protein